MTAANRPPDKASDATVEVRLRDEAATAALAAAVASALAPGMAIHLSGELGAGKTSFVRAMLRSLGHRGRVRSPTFTLVEPYNLPRFDLYHFDLYRFLSEDEWQEAGFDEYLGGDGIVVVEWPEMGGARLPAPDLAIRLEADPDDDDARRARLHAFGDRGRACLKAARDAGCFGSG